LEYVGVGGKIYNIKMDLKYIEGEGVTALRALINT